MLKTRRPKGGSEIALRAYLQELLENLPPRSDELVPEASAWITFQGIDPFYSSYSKRNNNIPPLLCAVRGDAPIRLVLAALYEAGFPVGGFLLSAGSFKDEEYVLVYLSPRLLYDKFSVGDLAKVWPPFNAFFLEDLMMKKGIKSRLWPDEEAVMAAAYHLPPEESWFESLSIPNGYASGPTPSSLYYHIDGPTVLRDLNGDDELLGLKPND